MSAYMYISLLRVSPFRWWFQVQLLLSKLTIAHYIYIIFEIVNQAPLVVYFYDFL